MIRQYKADLGRVDFFHHPGEGLHFVEKVPMLAPTMGGLGKLDLANPGFGRLSGVCGRHKV